MKYGALLLWVFIAGFYLGAWCNNDKAAERGERAGQKIRGWFVGSAHQEGVSK